MAFYQKPQYNYRVDSLVFDKRLWPASRGKTAESFDLCMHAWSETKERELLTFRGNIKGQCGNCVLQANCLSVPGICPYNRHQIAISCHFFHSFGRKHADVLTSSCAGHLMKTIKIGPTQKHVTSCVTGKLSTRHYSEIFKQGCKETYLCPRRCMRGYRLSCPLSFLYQRVN